MTATQQTLPPLKKQALFFVVLIGIVSLFADMTYEGARSINGPYLALLGANALTVGFVSGFGELIGYSLRLVSGYFASRTQQYWLITAFGYVCNLLAVPLLALVGQWQWAALLMILERLGKAIRVPPRDAMLSSAGEQLGSGFAFGLHQALDQIGGLAGPLLTAFVLYRTGLYTTSYAILLIPTVGAFLALAAARIAFPRPALLSVKTAALPTTISSNIFWLYLGASTLIAAGFADFPLLAFHFQKTHLLPKLAIPLTYAAAMGVSGIAAFILGRLYDRMGFVILILVTLVSLLFAPLVFFGNITFAIIGVLLWSIGVGAHESLMRAIVANLIPLPKRAAAYGTFNFAYGVAWFLGSVAMGALYDYSINAIVVFCLILQLSALPLLYLVLIKLGTHVWKK